jgi:hypothetical protein
MPSKVKVFTWLVSKNCILTKGNMLKRGWTANTECHFYSVEETMNHLLFECTFARFVWQMVTCAFDLVRPLESSEDMLGVWIHSFLAPLRKNALVVVLQCAGPYGKQEMMPASTKNPR